MEEISKEYQTQCAIAGDTQYKLETLGRDLRKMNDKLRELNKEAMKLKEAQDASAQAAAEQPAKVVEAEVVNDAV